MMTLNRILSAVCLLASVFSFVSIFIWGCWWHLASSLIFMFLHSAFADTADKEVEE